MSDRAGNKIDRAKLTPLRRLFPYLARYPRLVAAALLFLFLAAATTLALPLAVRRMIDHGFSGSDGGFINAYFGMLLVLALALSVSSALRLYFVISIGERVVADVRRDVFAHITRLSPDFFDRSQSGEIVSRLTADTTQIKSAVGVTTSMALRNLILGLGAAAAMILTSPWLSVMVLAAIPIIVLPLVGIGRGVRVRARTAQDTLADASAYASEQIGAIRTLQAYTNEPLVVNRFSAAVNQAYHAACAALRLRALLTGFAIMVIFSAIIGVLWSGAHSVLAGEMSAGTLSQFLIYAVIAAGALATLSEVWGELSQAAGAAERIDELLSERPNISAPEKESADHWPIAGEILFKDVGFSYPNRSESSALDGFDLEIEPGQTVAIVGPSGAGKSTIFSLLLRYYDVDHGSVSVDGRDVRDVSPKHLRQRFAVVPQDVNIFAASIYDNIAFGDPSADKRAVVDAAKAARVDEFVDQLELGYDTMVGERGVTLSGGQRQRIAIARALLRSSPILLLDEATSALDATSEALIQEALGALMANRTTLVIAHRLATVKNADKIIVLNKGQVAEQGTHAELAAKGGIYSELSRLQFAHQGID